MLRGTSGLPTENRIAVSANEVVVLPARKFGGNGESNERQIWETRHDAFRFDSLDDTPHRHRSSGSSIVPADSDHSQTGDGRGDPGGRFRRL